MKVREKRRKRTESVCKAVEVSLMVRLQEDRRERRRNAQKINFSIGV